MVNRKSGARVLCVLIGWVILSVSSLSSAAGDSVLRTQGLINSGGNLKAGYLLINEMRVYIDKMTQVMDHREIPIPVTELKPKRWVYVEIVKDPGQKTLLAKKIYLLPHYVNPEEKQRFPFMKSSLRAVVQ